MKSTRMKWKLEKLENPLHMDNIFLVGVETMGRFSLLRGQFNKPVAIYSNWVHVIPLQSDWKVVQ